MNILGRVCALLSGVGLLVVTATQVFGAVQSGETSTQLSPDSDGGGTAFTVSCAPDRALIGISGGSGTWVDRVQGICVQVTNDGKWIGSETSTPGSGGTSGTTFSIRCATNSAVVGLSGRAGSWLDRLQVHCRPLGNAGFVTRDNMALAGATGGTGGTTGFGPNVCDGDKPARGLTGMSANILGAAVVGRIGLRCATPAVFRLNSMTLMSFSTTMPNPTRGDVSVNRAAPASTPVALVTSNASIASVASSVTINAGQSSASFTIHTGPTAGCGTITASNAGVSRAQQLVVQPVPPTDLAHFEVGSPNRLLMAGGQYKGSVRIDGQHGFVVALSTSNPGVVSVPPSVTVARDAMGLADYSITAVGRGCATIIGTYGGWTFRRVVMVEDIGG